MLEAARSRRLPLPEIVLWIAASRSPSESQTSECSDLLSRSRATFVIVAQRQPGKLQSTRPTAERPTPRNAPTVNAQPEKKKSAKKNSPYRSRAPAVTVAILAQGTHRGDALCAALFWKLCTALARTAAEPISRKGADGLNTSNSITRKGLPHSAKVQSQRRQASWAEASFEHQLPSEK
jgi:hypothetical protein